MRIAGLALITALLLAVSGGTAVAQQATQRGYDETLGVIGEIETENPTQDTAPAGPAAQPTPPQQQPQAGDLPFTGLDVGIVVLLGAVLIGTGFVLRRTTRTDS
jgi:hypothetical protein